MNIKLYVWSHKNAITLSSKKLSGGMNVYHAGNYVWIAEKMHLNIFLCVCVQTS